MYYDTTMTIEDMHRYHLAYAAEFNDEIQGMDVSFRELCEKLQSTDKEVQEILHCMSRCIYDMQETNRMNLGL